MTSPSHKLLGNVLATLPFGAPFNLEGNFIKFYAARLNADVKSVLVKGRVDDVDGPALDLNSVPRRIWYQ